MKCCDCQATYIGETGRLTEHKRATTEWTGTLLNALPTVWTTINESLWKAGLLT